MKPSQIVKQISYMYPDFYLESHRFVRIEAKLQAIIEYLDEQAEKVTHE